MDPGVLAPFNNPRVPPAVFIHPPSVILHPSSEIYQQNSFTKDRPAAAVHPDGLRLHSMHETIDSKIDPRALFV